MFIIRGVQRVFSSLFNLPSSPDYQVSPNKKELLKAGDIYFDLVSSYKANIKNSAVNDVEGSQLKKLLMSTTSSKRAEIDKHRKKILSMEGGKDFLKHADIHYPVDNDNAASSPLPNRIKEALKKTKSENTLSNPEKKYNRSCFGFLFGTNKSIAPAPSRSGSAANLVAHR